MLEHKHLIIHAQVNWNPGPQDVHEMTKWLRRLVEEIDMKILHGPVVIYSEAEGNMGMTGFVIIETSHIAFHHWVPEEGEEFGELQLDVYTCSTLDPMEVIQMLDIFEPESVAIKYLDRENGLTEIPYIFKEE